jgi:hypothetical protein
MRFLRATSFFVLTTAALATAALPAFAETPEAGRHVSPRASTPSAHAAPAEPAAPRATPGATPGARAEHGTEPAHAAPHPAKKEPAHNDPAKPERGKDADKKEKTDKEKADKEKGATKDPASQPAADKRPATAPSSGGGTTSPPPATEPDNSPASPSFSGRLTNTAAPTP